MVSNHVVLWYNLQPSSASAAVTMNTEFQTT